ncbi:hypothetical protein ER308_07635 [Egibacter rhizosphaerae]|uniref:Uncharacterized protein n=1 Tax=Egibacter rhizosphaerae TaxID=1670831 RepID=A0A411YEA7_9ACTN|nr:hypothetical protein [Egibacter rhizosphaerae]QBI19437.1 hypothetical protein ER308_07635 [Egibacter rhizosphaerae]
MATKTQDEAVRNYLVALRDPDAMRDDERLAELKRKIEETDDELERLRLRQEVLDAERPPVEQFEQAFIKHAKAWAEQHGISDRAFQAEGVPPRVLRKAGFTGVRGGDGRRTSGTRRQRRSRVSADEVRKALPKGTFTIKQVEEATGASAAVVRRVVQEEVEAGRVSDQGSDPDHKGPGRAPRLYHR